MKFNDVKILFCNILSLYNFKFVKCEELEKFKIFYVLIKTKILIKISITKD